MGGGFERTSLNPTGSATDVYSLLKFAYPLAENGLLICVFYIDSWDLFY